MSTVTESGPRSATARVRPFTGWLWGAAGATALNVIVLLIANALLDGSVQTAQPGQEPTDLPAVAVIAASIMPLLVGAIALWILARFTTSSLRIWTWVVAVFTIASFAAPLTLPVDTGSKIALLAMHAITGAAAIWGQRRAVVTA